MFIFLFSLMVTMFLPLFDLLISDEQQPIVFRCLNSKRWTVTELAAGFDRMFYTPGRSFVR